MSAMENEISGFYSVLGHPLRRSIIKVIGETGEVGFTEMMKKLKVSVGTLYYNIDLMEGLVAQNKLKKYVLTPKGEIAYRLLQESEEKLISQGVKGEKSSGWYSILGTLTMHRLFLFLYESPRLSLPSAVAILIYGMFIIYEARLFPLIVLYTERPIVSSIYGPLLFLGGWIIINVLGNIIPYFFYGRSKEGYEALLIGSCYALLPTLVFPTVWVICRAYYIGLSLIVAQSIMLIFTGFSLCLLTTAISAAKGLRTEKGALISLIILYIAIGLFLIFFEF